MRIPRATQLPSGTWRTQVCSNGIRKSFTADTEDKAVRAAMLFLLHDDGSRIDQYLRTLTVGDAIDTYIEDRRNVLSPSTVRGYKQIRDNRFQKIMETPLSDPINWQAVVNAESRTCNAKTLKNAWGLLKSALTAAGVKIKEDPTLPQIVRNERPYFTPQQIKEFIALIEGDMYELPYLLCLHGLRMSEMLALKKKDVRNKQIHIEGAMVRNEDGNLVSKKTTKNVSSRRIVPVLIDRVNVLAAEVDTDLLCPYSPNGMNKHLHTITKNSDLPAIHFHSLRHSFASLCYHLGLSEMECMRLGGWSDINVMRIIYTHISEDDISAGTKKLMDFFSV